MPNVSEQSDTFGQTLTTTFRVFPKSVRRPFPCGHSRDPTVNNFPRGRNIIYIQTSTNLRMTVREISAYFGDLSGHSSFKINYKDRMCIISSDINRKNLD